MAKRGQTTTFEERLEIDERWQAGQTDREIAAEMNRSVAPQTSEFKCLSVDGSRKTRPYQLALAFSPSTWREMMSANALTSTT
jgi:hypothetical protein